MEWVIQLECRLAGQVLHRQDVATIRREATPLLPEHVGLTLRDGKDGGSLSSHGWILASSMPVAARAS
jgi:hypothetical protein